MAVSSKLIDRLNDLLMLDHDAVDAYQLAIDRITLTDVKNRLREFQADHRRHIVDLKALIEGYGAKAKDRKDADISMMPEGLVSGLKLEQIDGIVAFLQTGK